MRGQAGRRGDVDDRAAAAVADRRCAMLHAEHGARQVDRDRAVPCLDRGVDDALAGDRAGIVDQDVELAEMRQCRRDDLPPGCLVGDVLAQKHALPPCPASLCARPRPPRHRHRSATTAAPSRRNSSASAVPCPPAAPVISATLPVSLAIFPPIGCGLAGVVDRIASHPLAHETCNRLRGLPPKLTNQLPGAG